MLDSWLSLGFIVLLCLHSVHAKQSLLVIDEPAQKPLWKRDSYDSYDRSGLDWKQYAYSGYDHRPPREPVTTQIGHYAKQCFGKLCGGKTAKQAPPGSEHTTSKSRHTASEPGQTASNAHQLPVRIQSDPSHQSEGSKALKSSHKLAKDHSGTRTGSSEPNSRKPLLSTGSPNVDWSSKNRTSQKHRSDVFHEEDEVSAKTSHETKEQTTTREGRHEIHKQSGSPERQSGFRKTSSEAKAHLQTQKKGPLGWLGASRPKKSSRTQNEKPKILPNLSPMFKFQKPSLKTQGNIPKARNLPGFFRKNPLFDRPASRERQEEQGDHSHYDPFKHDSVSRKFLSTLAEESHNASPAFSPRKEYFKQRSGLSVSSKTQLSESLAKSYRSHSSSGKSKQPRFKLNPFISNPKGPWYQIFKGYKGKTSANPSFKSHATSGRLFKSSELATASTSIMSGSGRASSRRSSLKDSFREQRHGHIPSPFSNPGSASGLSPSFRDKSGSATRWGSRRSSRRGPGLVEHDEPGLVTQQLEEQSRERHHQEQQQRRRPAAPGQKSSALREALEEAKESPAVKKLRVKDATFENTELRHVHKSPEKYLMHQNKESPINLLKSPERKGPEVSSRRAEDYFQPQRLKLVGADSWVDPYGQNQRLASPRKTQDLRKLDTGESISDRVGEPGSPPGSPSLAVTQDLNHKDSGGDISGRVDHPWDPPHALRVTSDLQKIDTGGGISSQASSHARSHYGVQHPGSTDTSNLRDTLSITHSLTPSTSGSIHAVSQTGAYRGFLQSPVDEPKSPSTPSAIEKPALRADESSWAPSDSSQGGPSFSFGRRFDPSKPADTG